MFFIDIFCLQISIFKFLLIIKNKPIKTVTKKMDKNVIVKVNY
jgi:hypothetical protein